jgi:hypothetical protein
VTGYEWWRRNRNVYSIHMQTYSNPVKPLRPHRGLNKDLQKVDGTEYGTVQHRRGGVASMLAPPAWEELASAPGPHTHTPLLQYYRAWRGLTKYCVHIRGRERDMTSTPASTAKVRLASVSPPAKQLPITLTREIIQSFYNSLPDFL